MTHNPEYKAALEAAAVILQDQILFEKQMRRFAVRTSRSV